MWHYMSLREQEAKYVRHVKIINVMIWEMNGNNTEEDCDINPNKQII